MIDVRKFNLPVWPQPAGSPSSLAMRWIAVSAVAVTLALWMFGAGIAYSLLGGSTTGVSISLLRLFLFLRRAERIPMA